MVKAGFGLWLFLTLSLAAAGAPFKDSFGDLRDDLADAGKSGKALVLVFSMEGCTGCRALEETTLQDKSVRSFLQERYELIRLDLLGTLPIMGPNGEKTTESAFAAELGVFATPTVIVLDRHGKPVKRFSGGLPPAVFMEKISGKNASITNTH